jgi:hypothetical protein
VATGTPDHDLSPIEHTDTEHIPSDDNLTAVLEAPFDWSNLSGDAQNAHDGLSQRPRREDKKQNCAGNHPDARLSAHGAHIDSVSRIVAFGYSGQCPAAPPRAALSSFKPQAGAPAPLARLQRKLSFKDAIHRFRKSSVVEDLPAVGAVGQDDEARPVFDRCCGKGLKAALTALMLNDIAPGRVTYLPAESP